MKRPPVSQEISSATARHARPLRMFSVVMLVVGGTLGILAVAGGALYVLNTRGLSFTTGGPNVAAPAVSWAFPGLAFRPAAAYPDPTGWRVAYVLVNKEETLVVSVVRGAFQPTVIDGQPTVSLSDTANRAYQQTPPTHVPNALVSSDGASGSYVVTAFPALQAGTTGVVVRHMVPHGGTTHIPVNLSQLAALPRPLYLHSTRVSRGVSVTLNVVTRGALLSEGSRFHQSGGAGSSTPPYPHRFGEE